MFARYRIFLLWFFFQVQPRLTHPLLFAPLRKSTAKRLSTAVLVISTRPLYRYNTYKSAMEPIRRAVASTRWRGERGV